MRIEATVLAEDARASGGVEYVTITCMERGDEPMLQMFDYTLRENEKELKGKLKGKAVSLVVANVRSVFNGRPQFSGKLIVAGK